MLWSTRHSNCDWQWLVCHIKSRNTCWKRWVWEWVYERKLTWENCQNVIKPRNQSSTLWLFCVVRSILDMYIGSRANPTLHSSGANFSLNMRLNFKDSNYFVKFFCPTLQKWTLPCVYFNYTNSYFKKGCHCQSDRHWNRKELWVLYCMAVTLWWACTVYYTYTHFF